MNRILNLLDKTCPLLLINKKRYCDTKKCRYGIEVKKKN